MRKFTLVFAAILCLHSAIKAQSYLGQSEFNKSMVSATVNEIPYEEDVTDQAIIAKFKALGYSAKSAGDYKLFKGVKLSVLGPDTYDLYFRTDVKSKKEKNRTVVYMLISKGNENFVSAAADTQLFTNAKIFLDSFVADVASTDLENQIAVQEEILKKANKKLTNLTDDGQDFAKKKKKIEDQIANNANDQATQQKEVQQEQQILDMLKAKRKL